MSTNVQPVTFYVPSSAGEPMDVKVAHSGLRMVLVDRDAIRRLGDDWKVLGVYFLLGPDPASPDKFLAYIGEVGRRDLLLRLTEHAKQKTWWNRALLIASASTDGFNSAEIGWLEGRFYDVLNNAIAATVMNRGRPGDDSIQMNDRGVLERYVEPTIAALRAVGASPDTADQLPPPPGKKRAQYGESVKDLLDAGLLKPGTRLTPLRKGLDTTALVHDGGGLDVAGTSFTALSSAAKAVSGKEAEAGWAFWGAPSGHGGFVSLAELRDRLRAKPPGPPMTAADKSLADASGGPEGPPAQTRHGVTVTDLIEVGWLLPGQELHPTRRGRSERGVVLSSGEVQIGDRLFKSLSGAAKAVSGNSAEAGWGFWAIESDGRRVTLAELRARLLRRPEAG